MNLIKTTPTIAIIVTVLLMNGNGEVGSQMDSPRLLFEEAQKETYRLNFDKAYSLLSEIMNRYPDSSYREQVIILKNLISLGQTFSNLRLYSAYSQGMSLYKEETAANSLSPVALLESYKLEYLRRTRKWTKRLDSDLKESLKISEEIELSLRFPGSEELPYFVKAGIDTIANIEKGIPPTPSQAQNIEESESYAGVLAAIYLCIQKEFELPPKAFSISGMIIPKLLTHHSHLWIDRALAITEAEDRISSNLNKLF